MENIHTPLHRPWLLVFDLDGTLIDSSQDLCDSVNAALAEVGADSLPSSTISSFIGDGAAALVERALAASMADSGPSPRTLLPLCLKAFLHHYRLHKLDNTKPYPGVLTALQAIRDASPLTLMAVLTNKPVKPSREICEELRLAPFFFVNYGGDSFPTKKPAPDGLEAILREATLIAESRKQRLPSVAVLSSVIMVGDSEADILVGRVCGVRTAGCSYGLSPEATEKARPDIWVTKPSDLPHALGF